MNTTAKQKEREPEAKVAERLELSLLEVLMRKNPERARLVMNRIQNGKGKKEIAKSP